MKKQNAKFYSKIAVLLSLCILTRFSNAFEINGVKGISLNSLSEANYVALIRFTAPTDLNVLKQDNKIPSSINIPVEVIQTIKGLIDEKDIIIEVPISTVKVSSFIALSNFAPNICIVVLLNKKDNGHFIFSDKDERWMFVPGFEADLGDKHLDYNFKSYISSLLYDDKVEGIAKQLEIAAKENNADNIQNIVNSFLRVYLYQVLASRYEYGVDSTSFILKMIKKELEKRPTHIPVMWNELYKSADINSFIALLGFATSEAWSEQQRRQIDFIIHKFVWKLSGEDLLKVYGEIEALGWPSVSKVVLYRIADSHMKSVPLDIYIKAFNTSSDLHVRYAALYGLSESGPSKEFQNYQILKCFWKILTLL